MAIQIQVKLDTTANPPVTLIPNHQAVNRGNQSIEWTPFANETFTFVSLTFTTTPNPFSTPTVSNSQISVTDNNSSTADYPYVIVVSSGGVQYSTAPGLTADNSTPVIKNN